ncbi:MAG: hypothetical protein AAFX39_15870 [Pseudomonadota bacterium]
MKIVTVAGALLLFGASGMAWAAYGQDIAFDRMIGAIWNCF